MSPALPIIANGSVTATGSTDNPSITFNFYGQILASGGTVTITNLTDAALDNIHAIFCDAGSC